MAWAGMGRGREKERLGLPESSSSFFFLLFFCFQIAIPEKSGQISTVPAIDSNMKAVTDFSAPDHLKGIDAAQKRQEGAVSLSARGKPSFGHGEWLRNPPTESAIAIAKDLALDLGVRYLAVDQNGRPRGPQMLV